MVQKFLTALGPVQSKFSTVELPRKIEAMQETTMPSYDQWLESKKKMKLTDILPPQEELHKMTRKEIKEKYGHELHSLGLTDAELNDLIDKAAGIEDMPEPHHSHYHLHT
jgi:hypothetical protein